MLAPALAAYVRDGGRIVLSGVLAEQADEINGIYGEWFDMAPAVTEEGWARLMGTKHCGKGR